MQIITNQWKKSNNFIYNNIHCSTGNKYNLRIHSIHILEVT